MQTSPPTFKLPGKPNSIHLFTTDLKSCSDPFCVQLCHLTSSLLTTVSDLSDAAKIRLVEFGIPRSLLQALRSFKDATFDEVEMQIED